MVANSQNSVKRKSNSREGPPPPRPSYAPLTLSLVGARGDRVRASFLQTLVNSTRRSPFSATKILKLTGGRFVLWTVDVYRAAALLPQDFEIVDAVSQRQPEA